MFASMDNELPSVHVTNGTNGNFAGHVRVYTLTSISTWEQVGADIDGETGFDQSGYSVAMSADGKVIAIGAINNDGSGSNVGNVRVYSSSSGSWVRVGLDIDGEIAGDTSGQSVAISSDGTTVAIGANLNDGNGSTSGHVRVYKLSTGSWRQVGEDIDGERRVRPSHPRSSQRRVRLKHEQRVHPRRRQRVRLKLQQRAQPSHTRRRQRRVQLKLQQRVRPSHP
jgi:hypothetical protein